MIRTVLFVVFTVAYVGAIVFGVRRERGSITLRGLSEHRSATPIDLARDMRATGGRNLAAVDKFLMLIAYAVISIVLGAGVIGIIFRLVTQ
jgi:hypothetical protein